MIPQEHGELGGTDSEWGGARTIAEGGKHDSGAIRATIQQPKCRRCCRAAEAKSGDKATPRGRGKGEASSNEGGPNISTAKKFVWFSIPPYGKAQTNLSANLTVTRSSRYLKSRKRTEAASLDTWRKWQEMHREKAAQSPLKDPIWSREEGWKQHENSGLLF